MAVQQPPEVAPTPRPELEADADSAGVRPYVPDSVTMPELTWSAVLLGAGLGVVFGASSLYLVLRVGMTVSASIPVAVLSITLFRSFSRWFGTRRATILENNIVQTAGSAGESIAFGVGVTMPALLILGYDMGLAHVMLVAGLGGLLGILMMIPLRRAFIVRKHRELKYPEGTACAKVLIVGEQGGASARTVFAGFGLAAAYQFLMQAMHLWVDIPERAIRGFRGAVIGCEASPALLGVGYIIGPRISSIMVAGGVLSALVLTPAIAYFGAGVPGPIAPAVAPIAAMSADDIQRDYILYIGAGAVATGGIISVFQVLPMILGSAAAAFRDLAGRRGAPADAGDSGPRRTGRDLPMAVVVLGSVGLVWAIAASSLITTDVVGRLAGAVLIVLFGFLFVTVSSRLTGEVGSSSNPISGMTVATLLLTCLAFVLQGWVGAEYQFAALSIAAVVCIAASNGGTTSQDLKTGHLVGGTPRAQQLAILVGALTSAMVIGGTLLVLNDAGTIYTTRPEHQRELTVDPATLAETTTYGGTEYRVWRLKDGIQGGKYLVAMDAELGDPTSVYVDPAINGRVQQTDDGRRVVKYNAPKATLMATIIDGIMGDTLPWGLVLIGVFIAIVLQLAGVPALPFAVGVYLPLSASAPIFVGGMARGLVDWLRKSTPEESDSGPAVLMASGYIAGGTITAILVTVALTFLPGLADALNIPAQLGAPAWSEEPTISLVAFGVMAGVLVLVGLGVLLRDRESKAVEEGTTGRFEAPEG